MRFRRAFLSLFAVLWALSCTDSEQLRLAREIAGRVLLPALAEGVAASGSAAGRGLPVPLRRGRETFLAKQRVAGISERLAMSPVVGAKPLSQRSLTLKLALASGDSAVFKPLRRGNRSARWEVAFGVLAPLIDAGLVPRSELRRIPLRQLVSLLSVRHPQLADSLRREVLVDGRGNVGGAVVEWISELSPSRLEGQNGKRNLARLLGPLGHAGEDAALAAAVSRMTVGDHVLGNWDRYSGGNLFEDPSGESLWLVDNNGTFASWSNRQKKRMESQLRACNRFSASQMDKLRSLTASSIRGALRPKESSGVVSRLLSDDEISLVLERRDEVLERVEDLVESRGSASVLSLP